MKLRKPRLLTILVSITLSLTAAAVAATDLPWWQEPFELTDPILKTHLEAHGVWIGESQVSCAGGTCSIELDPYLNHQNDPAKPICPDVEVYALPHGSGFFGGVLVGEDLFLTVHTAGANNCANRRIVFGLAATVAASELLVPLAPGETLTYEVPASDVYHCQEILGGGTTVGWTLVRLDNPVTGRRPVKLLRSGLHDPGTETVTAGYPDRLAMKVEVAELISSQEGAPGNPTSAGGSNAAHVLGGSSGSMVLAPSNRLLGVVCCGDTGWWINDNGCYRPDPTNATSSSFDRPFGSALPLVPPIGLEITHPGHNLPNALIIEHYGPPGGPFTNEQTQHRMTAGATGSAVSWRLTMPDSLIYFAPDSLPSSGTLSPGANLDFSVDPTDTAYNAGVGAAGNWILFQDLTYETFDTELHLLFVGVDSFSLEEYGCVGNRCTTDFLGDGPSGALINETKSYQLTSRWNTDQTLTVSGPPWIEFSQPATIGSGISLGGGASGNPLTVSLAAGATAQITAELIATQDVGTQEATLLFESSFAGQTMHQEQALVRGDLGRWVVDADLDETFIPGSTTEVLTALRIPAFPALDVDFCLRAVNVDPEPTAGFGDPPNYRLRSSSGAEIDLGAYWGERCFSDELFTPPPLRVVHQVLDLQNFEGDGVGGSWALIIEAPQTDKWEQGRLEWTSWRWTIDP